MKLLRKIHNLHQSAARHLLEGSKGVTLSQLLTLDAIASEPGASQTALVDATGIDRSTLATIVHRLCRDGLAERARREDDTRAYAVKLTAEGRRTVKAGRAAAEKAERAVYESAAGLASEALPS